MSVLTFAQWVQFTRVATAIREQYLPYPAILSLHLTFIALSAGMILATNLRLLDVALRRRSVADVIDQLRWPKRIGFVAVATCGLLLASSKAEEYYYNAFFWAKMSLLALIAVHGLVFRGTVYNKAAAMDQAGRIPARAKLAASLSIVLWIGVVCCGRGIGYIEPPLDKLHAANSADFVAAAVTQNSPAAQTPRGPHEVTFE
jgi:hypothetical protein